MEWLRRVAYSIAAPGAFAVGYLFFRLIGLSDPVATILSVPLSLPPALVVIVDIYPALNTERYRSSTTKNERWNHIASASVIGAGFGIPASLAMLQFGASSRVLTEYLPQVSTTLNLLVALAILRRYTRPYFGNPFK